MKKKKDSSEKNAGTEANGAQSSDVKDRIALCVLDLSAERGWQYVTLPDIAQHLNMALEDLRYVMDGKDDALVFLGRWIDRQVLHNVSSADSEAHRERLFDCLMDRYEILNTHRVGVSAILDSFACDPKQILISMPHLCRSMSWMLEASGLETVGFKGAVRVTGLTGIYLKVLRTWYSDESTDLSQTMAALDRALARADGLAVRFGF